MRKPCTFFKPTWLISRPEMSQCNDEAHAVSLASLPPCILSQIARNPGSERAAGPLLATARFGRDAILSTCRAVTLRHDKDQPEAKARLLHRVCTQAHAGLEVHLNLAKDLPVLLKPGIDAGGWNRVQTLEVHCHEIPAELGAAFPSVQHLGLWDAKLGGGSLFRNPCTWRNVCSLALGNCRFDSTAESAVASALASLPNLTSLVLADCPCLGITTQLTRLTGLLLNASGIEPSPAEEDVISVAARNPQLESARLVFGYDPTPLDAHQLQHLLQSCSHLTHLDLCSSVIDQAGLDALLQHGKCIHSLSVDSFVLSASRADAQCSWQSVSLERGISILQFAHLPLKDIQVILTGARWNDIQVHGWNPENGSVGKLHLMFPLSVSEQMPLEQLSSLLHKAATSLAACPAWEDAPLDTITITGDIPQHQHLLSALAPLGGPHIKELVIDPQQDATAEGDMYMSISAFTVRALAESLGNAATTVTLNRCLLTRDFWAAFTVCFPAVERLDISSSVGYNKIQLALWCYAMRRPLHVICNSTAGNCECNNEYMGEALEDFGCPDVVFEFR